MTSESLAGSGVCEISVNHIPKRLENYNYLPNTSGNFVANRKSGKGRQSYPQHQHSWNHGNPSSVFIPNGFENPAIYPEFSNGNMDSNVETPSIPYPQHPSGSYSNPLLWNVPRGAGSYGPVLDQNNHRALCPFPPPVRPMVPMPSSNMSSPPRMNLPQQYQPPGTAHLASSPQRGMNHYAGSYKKSFSRQRGRRVISPRVSRILARKNSVNDPRMNQQLGKDRHPPFCPPAQRPLLPFPDSAVVIGRSSAQLAESTANFSHAFTNSGPKAVPSFSQNETLRLMNASNDILSQVDVPTLLDSIKRLDATNLPVQQAPFSPVVKEEFDIPCITPRSPSPSPPPADNVQVPEKKVIERESEMPSSGGRVGGVENSLPLDLSVKPTTEAVDKLNSAARHILEGRNQQTMLIKSEAVSFSPGMDSTDIFRCARALYDTAKLFGPVSLYSTNRCLSSSSKHRKWTKGAASPVSASRFSQCPGTVGNWRRPAMSVEFASGRLTLGGVSQQYYGQASKIIKKYKSSKKNLRKMLTVPVLPTADSTGSVTLNIQASGNTVHSSRGLLGYRSVPPTDVRHNKLEDYDDYSRPQTPPADFSSFGDRSPDRKPLAVHEAHAIPTSHRGTDIRRKVAAISRQSDWEACSDEGSSPDRKLEKRRNKDGRIESKVLKSSKIESKSTSKSTRSTRKAKGDPVLEKKKSKKSRDSTAKKKNKVKSFIVKPGVDWVELHCSSDESDSNFPKISTQQGPNFFGESSVTGFSAEPTNFPPDELYPEFDPEYVLESSTVCVAEQDQGNFFGENLIVTLDDNFFEHAVGDIVADSEEILRARLIAAMDKETETDVYEIAASLPSEKKLLCVGQDSAMARSNNSVSFNFTSLLPPSSTEIGSPTPEVAHVSIKKETVDRKSFRITVDAGSKEPEPRSSSRDSSTDRSQASGSSFFGRLISNSVDTITPDVFQRSNSPSTSASLFPEPSLEKKLFRRAKFERPLSPSTKLIVPALRKKTVEVAKPIPVISSSKHKSPVKPKKVKNKKGRKKSVVTVPKSRERAQKSVGTKSTKIKLPPLQRVSRLDKIAAVSEDPSYPGSLLEPSDVIGSIQSLETELEEIYWEDTEIAERIHSLENSLRAAFGQRSRIWMNLDDMRMKAEQILHDNAGVEETVVEPVGLQSTDPFVRLTKEKRSPTPVANGDREELVEMDELICPNYIRVPPWNSAVVERPLCFDEDPLLCALRDLRGKLTNKESHTKDTEAPFVDITDDNDAEVLEGLDSVGFSEIDRHTFSYVSETLRGIGLQRFQNGFADIGKRSPFSEAFLVEVDPQITYCFCGDEVSCIRYHIPPLSAEGRREKIQQELTRLIFDISDTADDLLQWKAAIDDLEDRVQEDASYEYEAAQLWVTLMEKLVVE